MLRGLSRILWILAFTLCLALPCSASFSTLLDLKRDSADAELVCVGHAVFDDSNVDGIDNSPQMVVDFQVDRVLKGTLKPGSSIKISFKSGQQHFFGYDLVLLKKQGELYEFSRPEGSIAASEAVRSEYRQSDDVLANLRWEMINSLQDSSKWVVMSALEQSSLLLPSDIGNFVGPKINDANPRTRALAFQAYLTAGVEAAVIPSLDLIEQVEPSLKTSESKVPLSLIAKIKQFQIRPETVGSVASKLNSKCDLVRELASFMLRESKHKAALPHLKRLLDDPSFEVRYNAVIGMAYILDDMSHAPSIDEFTSKEGSYIDYWKAKALN